MTNETKDKIARTVEVFGTFTRALDVATGVAKEVLDDDLEMAIFEKKCFEITGNLSDLSVMLTKNTMSTEEALDLLLRMLSKE